MGTHTKKEGSVGRGAWGRESCTPSRRKWAEAGDGGEGQGGERARGGEGEGWRRERTPDAVQWS